MIFESAKSAAERLGCTVRAIQKWAKEGKIPYAYKDGRENVKYSDEEYNFSIEITLNVANELVATIIFCDEKVEEFAPEFVNEYNYTPTPPTPPTPPTEPEAPKTGDNFNINLWLALLFVSGTGIFGGLAFGRKIKAK